MIIIKSRLLESVGGIKFGFSTKSGLNRKSPFFFNLSFLVGDDENTVSENRKLFLENLGLDESNTVFQKQVHGDNISIIDDPDVFPEGDALITDKKGIGLAVSSADCTPVFIYDPVKEIIAAVHSGWRSTEKRILTKTLDKLIKQFGCSANNMVAFIAPCISQKNYEVGEEVAGKFHKKYFVEHNGKLFLDLKSANRDMLLDAGLDTKNIEVSGLCSFEKDNLLHSYRRDGEKSGRAIGVIKMEAI